MEFLCNFFLEDAIGAQSKKGRVKSLDVFVWQFLFAWLFWWFWGGVLFVYLAFVWVGIFTGNHTLYTFSSLSTSNQNNLLRSSLSAHIKSSDKQWSHFPYHNSWCCLEVCSFLPKFGDHWMADIASGSKTAFCPCSNIHCFWLDYTEQTKFWNHG